MTTTTTPRKKKKEATPPPPVIEVGETMPDPSLLIDQLDQIRRDEIEKEFRRQDAAKQIAKYRIQIARTAHLLEDGQSMLVDREGNFKTHPFQEEIYKDDSLDLVIYGSAQYGKLQALDAKVHTPAGWTTMGEIKIGDKVSIPDGGCAQVSGIFPQGMQRLYKLTFEDGRTAEAGGDHRWEICIKPRRAAREKHLTGSSRRVTCIVTTLELRDKLETLDPKHWNIVIPLSQPLQKPTAVLPIHPYLLGMILADGSIAARAITYTKGAPELIQRFKDLLPDCLQLKHRSRYDYGLSRRKGCKENPIRDALDALGLMGKRSYEKFIPRIYLDADTEQRFALLQGLMDSDGYASLSMSYSTSSQQLSKDVQELVWSVGGVANIKEKWPTYRYKGKKLTGRLNYGVNVKHREPHRIFRFKSSRVTDRYQFAHTLGLGVKSIEFSREAQSQCIMVDHPRHLYVTDNYVCTRNTEFLIVDMAASAAFGLKVLFVTSTMTKRNSLVTGRVDPCFGTVKMYSELMNAAAERNAKADSTSLKHFGPGQITFIFANSEKGFTSHVADKALIDEHQECNLENVKMVDDRMSGSWYRGLIRVGHPSTAGTEINQNLDYLYQNSDRRIWKVPCGTCKKMQLLTWLNHIIYEERGKGGILAVKPRDEEWRPGNKFDIRPICDECHRPMNRLSRQGMWEAQAPGHKRHGYKLSNIFNANKRLDELFDRYSSARHSANAMQSFVNKQLGETWDMDGSKITDGMLNACAAGHSSGVAPYRFISAQHMTWKKDND